LQRQVFKRDDYTKPPEEDPLREEDTISPHELYP
jgi:hypothetical protein